MSVISEHISFFP